MSISEFIRSIRETVADQQRDIYTATPAKVVTFDASSYKISAQPLIKNEFIDEDGVRQSERVPVISEIPVVMPGSGGTRIKFQLSPGDEVLLIFCQRSIDNWIRRGGEVSPEDDRSHSIDDAVAIPGLQNFLSASDADVMIEFTSNGEIHAGGDDDIALNDELVALRDAIAGAASGDAVPAAAGGVTINGTSVLKGS